MLYFCGKLSLYSRYFCICINFVFEVEGTDSLLREGRVGGQVYISHFHLLIWHSHYLWLTEKCFSLTYTLLPEWTCMQASMHVHAFVWTPAWFHLNLSLSLFLPGYYQATRRLKNWSTIRHVSVQHLLSFRPPSPTPWRISWRYDRIHVHQIIQCSKEEKNP